jgi:hypothetical protein
MAVFTKCCDLTLKSKAGAGGVDLSWWHTTLVVSWLRCQVEYCSNCNVLVADIFLPLSPNSLIPSESFSESFSEVALQLVSEAFWTPWILTCKLFSLVAR